MINYEDYESNKEFLFSCFPNEKDNRQIIEDSYLGKIPYVSDDYSIYFEKSVREILKSWGILSD